MKWLENIKIDELPRQYRELAEIIGLANTLKVAEYCGKVPVYFPSLDATIRAKKEEYIVKNFKGDNHAELARDTDYSLVWVYEILKRAKKINAIKQRMLF